MLYSCSPERATLLLPKHVRHDRPCALHHIQQAGLSGKCPPCLYGAGKLFDTCFVGFFFLMGALHICSDETISL